MISRKAYMMELYKLLVTPWLQERAKIPTLQRSLRETIDQLLKQTITEDREIPQEEETEPNRSKRCSCASCPSSKRRMTTRFCSICKKPFCNEHRGEICKSCA